MHTVFALLCFVVVIHWLIFPYPSGLLHWHCGNLTIAPVPAKQPWWIWIDTSFEFIMNDYITTTKQSTTKPCAYFLGYSVARPFVNIYEEIDRVITAPHCIHMCIPMFMSLTLFFNMLSVKYWAFFPSMMGATELDLLLNKKAQYMCMMTSRRSKCVRLGNETHWTGDQVGHIQQRNCFVFFMWINIFCIEYILGRILKTQSMFDVANMLKIYCQNVPVNIYEPLNVQACSLRIWVHPVSTQSLVVSC